MNNAYDDSVRIKDACMRVLNHAELVCDHDATLKAISEARACITDMVNVYGALAPPEDLRTAAARYAAAYVEFDEARNVLEAQINTMLHTVGVSMFPFGRLNPWSAEETR